MPELPEAETVSRTLYPHVYNCVFSDALLLRQSSLHPLSLPLASLAGSQITGVWRRGKLIILNLDARGSARAAPEHLIFHLRMTGRLFTADASREPGVHTRCLFALDGPGGKRLFFDDTRAFGQILAADKQALLAWSFWRELGPEPLEIDAGEFAARLKGARPIKSALLDQKVIAGIGNIYADEALFGAGVHPLAPANTLDGAQATRLLASMQAVLKKSISQCGSSIRDYRDANGNTGAFQNSFAVYGRGGQSCQRCGETLRKIKVSGRATVFCPHCQK